MKLLWKKNIHLFKLNSNFKLTLILIVIMRYLYTNNYVLKAGEALKFARPRVMMSSMRRPIKFVHFMHIYNPYVR